MDSKSNETRAKLLDAGIRLFAENGYKGVSVREICSEAAANVAAVQYHFGGKEGLYRAIFETMLDEDEPRFRECMSNLNTLIDAADGNRDQLSVALSMYVKSFFARFPFHEKRQWFSVLVTRELSFPGIGFDLIFERRAKPSQDVFVNIIAAIKGLDENSEEARLQAYVLTGTLLNIIVSQSVLFRFMDWDSFSEQTLTRLSQTVTTLIFNALMITPPNTVVENI